MGTKMIKPCKNGADITKLTVNQQRFILEAMANEAFDMSAAAKSAGYKNPSQAANKLMKNKTVMKALGKAMRERSERVQLKADDVLSYLRDALFFNPAKLFVRNDEGGYTVKNLDELPDSIGCLIESIEMDEHETEAGVSRKFKLKTIPHAITLPLAMKHLGLLTEKLEATLKTNIDWDELFALTQKEGRIDPVEQAILDVKSEPIKEN
jgi:hypothetical protein